MELEGRGQWRWMAREINGYYCTTYLPKMKGAKSDIVGWTSTFGMSNSEIIEMDLDSGAVA